MHINNRMAVVIPNYLRGILILCEEYEREYRELLVRILNRLVT